jgi:hypothetical protein
MIIPRNLRLLLENAAGAFQLLILKLPVKRVAGQAKKKL